MSVATLSLPSQVRALPGSCSVPPSHRALSLLPRSQVEEEAKKIAEAVTRVITSPAVSKKIADLAMDAAASKVGPGDGDAGGGGGEASQTGAVTGGVSGMGASGYADEPVSVAQIPARVLACALLLPLHPAIYVCKELALLMLNPRPSNLDPEP